MRILIFVSMISSPALADRYEDYDSNPQKCAEIRREANNICRGDADCYTSQVSRLVDLYNYNQERDGKEATYLYCSY